MRILAWVSRHVDVMRQLKAQGFKIIVLDESYVHVNHSVNHMWAKVEEKAVFGAPKGRGQRAVFLGAGSDTGWVPGMFKTWCVFQCSNAVEYSLLTLSGLQVG